MVGCGAEEEGDEDEGSGRDIAGTAVLPGLARLREPGCCETTC